LNNLINAARCALADLAGRWEDGTMQDWECQTFIDLYTSLEEVGQDVSDYKEDLGYILTHQQVVDSYS